MISEAIIAVANTLVLADYAGLTSGVGAGLIGVFGIFSFIGLPLATLLILGKRLGKILLAASTAANVAWGLYLVYTGSHSGLAMALTSLLASEPLTRGFAALPTRPGGKGGGLGGRAAARPGSNGPGGRGADVADLRRRVERLEEALAALARLEERVRALESRGVAPGVGGGRRRGRGVGTTWDNLI